jgi:DNA primase
MSYEEFSRTIKPANESELLNYLKTEEDKTHIEVDSALNYLKLRKIKRMLLENQADMDKPHTDEERLMLYSTHQHLKQMEIEITKKLGSVIIN